MGVVGPVALRASLVGSSEERLGVVLSMGGHLPEVSQRHYSGLGVSCAVVVAGVTATAVGLADGDTGSVSPSRGAGTRSVAAERDSSAGEARSSGAEV
jgi:hypothetical protein